MRLPKLLLFCLSCCLLLSCMSITQPIQKEKKSIECIQEAGNQEPDKQIVRTPSIIAPPSAQLPQRKNLQYQTTVYQQWIILGAYILTTAIMAFYTKKQSRRKKQVVQQVTDTLLSSNKVKHGLFLRLFRLFSKIKRRR